MTDETATANETAAVASAETGAGAVNLSDYGFATGTFNITARNLSVKRVWAIDGLEWDTAPELRTVIHGQAFVQYGSVRVIGEDKAFTEFDINLRSSENNKAEREWGKAHELSHDGSDAWERRRRKLRDEVFDVSPPTAVLSVGKWEGSDWKYIECKLDPSLLRQLADELLAGRVDHLTIGIKWVDGPHREMGPAQSVALQAGAEYTSL
jgi:hypothetical protein